MSSYFLPYVSGAIMVPYRVLSHLSAQGHSVHVFTFKYDTSLKNRETLDGIEVHRVKYDIKIVKGFLSFSYPLRIFSHLKQSDVILFNQPVFEGLFVVFLAKIMRKNVISLFNCEVDLGKGAVNRIVTWGLKAAVFLQLLLSDTIVTYTEDYAGHNALLTWFQKKLRFILPPVPKPDLLQEHKRNFSRVKQGNKWVCFCGRVSKEKGLEYFVRSYQYLKHKDGIVYVFVGPYGKEVVGEEDYYEGIKAELKALKVPHLFLGKISDREMGAFYKSIDCLVLPSVNRTEAFGIVQVEAMLFGKPVVASNLPGVRIPVSMTGMGCLCEPGDARDLAQKIDLILNDDAFITDEKRQNVAAHFDPAKVYAEWEKVFTSNLL